MNAVVPFNFGSQEVRVVTIDGEPWFVLNDLAKVLGLSRSASQIVDRIEGDLRQAYPIRDSLGRVQNTTIVNEAGMYEVVIRSDKPDAAKFRRWITAEVLPTIRKTGAYGAPALTEEEIVHQALQITAAKVQQLEAKVAEDAPKVDYVDTFVTDDDLRVLRNVAKSVGVQESLLREALVEHEWIYAEHTKRWSEKQQAKVPYTRYSPYASKRHYFRPVPVHEAPRFRGEVMHTLKVTPEGARAIARAAITWGLADV